MKRKREELAGTNEVMNNSTKNKKQEKSKPEILKEIVKKHGEQKQYDSKSTM